MVVKMMGEDWFDLKEWLQRQKDIEDNNGRWEAKNTIDDILEHMEEREEITGG